MSLALYDAHSILLCVGYLLWLLAHLDPLPLSCARVCTFARWMMVLNAVEKLVAEGCDCALLSGKEKRREVTVTEASSRVALPGLLDFCRKNTATFKLLVFY